MNITDLKCEFITNPIGLDIQSPQFSWQMQSDKRGVMQIAYQLLVANSPEDLFHNNSVVWDSGKIYSSKSVGIRYVGPELESRRRYYWLVRIWASNNSKVVSSEAAFFEMGLLNPSDWQALWIGCPASRIGRVLYFRRELSLTGHVKKARVYISGLGYYVLYINGKRVGNNVLDPGTSNYEKRVLYTTYDIADFLEKENVFCVIVGPGWYGVPKLCMQAEITFNDDHAEVIATGWDPYNNWLVTTGPIIHSSIFDGEFYDAREEKYGWFLPGRPIDGLSRTNQWISAYITDAPGGRMVSQFQEPIKVVDTLTPAIISQPKKKVYILDAGRNLAGWAFIKVRGKRGTKISMRFAELLNPDGTVNQQNLRSATAEDIYILKGGDEEQWEPSFTYHGFRFIQLEGLPYKPKEGDVRVRVVRSAVDSTGSFTCSNELMNRIHQMVRLTEESNLHSIPTDCPQRDERMGWLNDMTVRHEQALYNFNLSRFYTKWLDDISDTQAADGTITDTAPFHWGFRPADPASAISYLLIAFKSYEFYGNERIISQHYNGFKAWVNYLLSRTEDGIVNYSYWGDWSPPEKYGIPGSIGSGAVSKYTPGKLISTGYLYYCTRIISEIASILGNKKDKMFYQKIGRETAEAFNKVFWNEKVGGYGSNNQACNSFALYLGLVGERNKQRVLDNLVQDIISLNYHLSTGNLCTKYLLEVLTENGYSEVAYKLVNQETYPSWGYMLANGASTLWERWENKTGGEMNSHNHPMMGSVGSWFFKYILGILPDLDGPGFEKFMIKPYIFNELDFAEGEFNSVKGSIKVAWRKVSDSFSLELTIPENSTAKVFIPTKNRKSITVCNRTIDHLKEIKFLQMEEKFAVFEVGSGSYCFKVIMRG